MGKTADKKSNISFDKFKEQVLNDYKTALVSREASLLGRREVLTGKAKFGIFGDGKEVPQLAMARSFKNGDFRSGYYRDQTLMFAKDLLKVQEFFAGLYAHTDQKAEPMSGGRQMGGHFSTQSLDENGEWKNLMEQGNSSADISPTAGQMPRLLGLAQASKIYRKVDGIEETEKFTDKGSEIAWGTIGNASTSEGHFWETINAAGVMQVPMVMSIWDDEYGISVPAKYQTTKEDISEILKGFQRDENNKGYEILRVNGWNYPELIETYEKAEKIAREEHAPVIIHVRELTQPQGHSTSGSHERYKSKDRLQWEQDYDCNAQMRQWILDKELADESELEDMEKAAKKEVKDAKKQAWKNYTEGPQQKKKELIKLFKQFADDSGNKDILKIGQSISDNKEPKKFELLTAARRVIVENYQQKSQAKDELAAWIKDYKETIQPEYSSHLYSENAPAVEVPEVEATYDDDAEEVDGRVVLRNNFDAILGNYSKSLIFGEDSGEIGDVNQGLEGLQEKYGVQRVNDTGIRESTIIGQGVGMAMRGLRPIAEIQYLDYILYCIQTMSDDLSTLHYRTRGTQKAPLIVRTRGHRLEGIWHSGSPMGAITHLLRGMNVLVPRNMTKAAGFYNTLLKSDEPGLIVECLNGYRLKEQMPNNLGELQTPVGKVETIREGSDITIVSYGSVLRQISDAADKLSNMGIDAEIVDVQSLMPLDIDQDIVESVKKTNRLLVIDEDVPGGASAHILQDILDRQDAYRYLDSRPQTLTSRDHRPAYSTNGDYFSKPSTDDITEKIYSFFNEVDPENYPDLY